MYHCIRDAFMDWWWGVLMDRTYMQTCDLCIIIRLIGFSRCSRVWLYFRRKWTDLDEIWSTLSTLSGLALANSGRDTRSSDSWRARQIFCQVSNARFHRFPVSQISRNLNTTRRSVSRWKLSEQNLENFTVRGRFPKKRKNVFKSFDVLQFRTPTSLPAWRYCHPRSHGRQ